MAKAYKFTEEKRAWAANVSRGLKRYAEVSRCPKCDRKNAFHKQDGYYTVENGYILRKCRYCKFWRSHRLDNDAVEEGYGK